MRSRRMKRETAREDVPRVRVRGPGARLQGRSHARAVSDRARQDSPESIVGDVRATPAPARHGDQAGAPARPAALHQGVRRLSRWRLAVGVLLFAALAPLSLVALPRSEEHTSELQSRLHLVCRLLLEKKKKSTTVPIRTLTIMFTAWKSTCALTVPFSSTHPVCKQCACRSIALRSSATTTILPMTLN